jgi:hypothetical protein
MSLRAIFCAVLCNLQLKLLFFVLFLSTVYAQDSTNFFPHNDGDFVQYLYWNGFTYEYLHVNTIVDSTDIEGNVYITRDFWFLNPWRKDYNFDIERYKIDTLNRVYSIRIYSGQWQENLYYDLNADTNEIWINEELGVGFYFALIREEYTDTLFNMPTTVKIIDFYAGDTARIDYWQGQYTEKLADGFGLIYRGGYDFGYFIWATGARINNIEYGDIIITSLHNNPIPKVPKKILLYQNYPNPFNPSTIISYQLTKSTKVSLKVYDILGRLVRTLIGDELLNPGMHTLPWDGKSDNGEHVSSGTYYYELKTGQYSLTKKMQLIH